MEQNTKVFQSEEEIIAAFKEFGTKLPQSLVGFYHGGLKGIIKDPKFMLIPFVDKIVHRGYAVFDTLTVLKGKLYNVPAHMDRFFDSMAKAKLNPPNTREEIVKILTELVVATGEQNLHLRYWTSRGGADLDIVTAPDVPTVFYAIALKCDPQAAPKSAKVYTASVPVKPKLLAEMKTTNYILNCLAGDECKLKGGFTVFVNDQGLLMESNIFGVGFVMKDKSYYTPEYNNLLLSTTNDRVIALIEKHLIPDGTITKIVRAPMKKAEDLKKEAAEMFLVGCDKIIGLSHWDDVQISEGQGAVTAKIVDLFFKDEEDPEVTTPVNY